jgi:phosphatidylglycerol:prolipoprotein diacylglycerol transferase
VIAGIVGARLYHVIDLYTYYFRFPIEILYIWQGGLGIIGAIIGGLIGLLYFLRKRKLKVMFWTDLVIVSLPLAQAIGRLGNYFNKENFGTPTALPWGQFIQKERRPAAYTESEYFHPVYFYEAILNLILFGILYYLYKSKKITLGSGTMFYTYLIGYSLIRLGLELLRVNVFSIAGLNVAQVISILVILISSYRLLK